MILKPQLIKEKGNLHLTMDAGQIGNLLCVRHSDDVIVQECKNGETWGARDLLRLDAWVLRRTYSPLTTIGYEIKTSRADFENDQKWTSYLDLCHLFYFVCPAGLIRNTDLPSNIGIIWASKDRLHVMHKAERHNPDTEKLQRLLIYVLMARSKIVDNYDRNKVESDPIKERVKYIEECKAKKELAYIVKGHIKEIEDKQRKKESELSYRETNVKEFERRLARLGITWDSTNNDWQDNNRVGKEIDLLKKVLDEWTIRNLADIGKRMVELAENLKKFIHEEESSK